MSYYGLKELVESFRTVRANTIKVAEEIPEDQYGYRVTPDSQSVGEILVHIAVAPRLQHQIHFVERRPKMDGFDFFGFMASQAAEVNKSRSKQEIIDLLKSEGEVFAQALDGLPEDFLAEQVQFPAGMTPPSKSRFEMLMSPKEHEIHHRGQLMVAQRLLGITPHLTRQMQERIAAMKSAQGRS